MTFIRFHRPAIDARQEEGWEGRRFDGLPTGQAIRTVSKGFLDNRTPGPWDLTPAVDLPSASAIATAIEQFLERVPLVSDLLPPYGNDNTAPTPGETATAPPPSPPSSGAAPLVASAGVVPPAGIEATLAPAAPINPTAPRPNDLNAEQIAAKILALAPVGSPLREDPHTLAQDMVNASERTGVPAWLMLCQMQFENGLGNPRDGLIRERENFDGNGACVAVDRSHNLFGFKGTHPATGHHVLVGAPGAPKVAFQAFSCYRDSIDAYAAVIDGNYRGLTLDEYVERYFPVCENGQERFNEYRQAIITAAQQWGGGRVIGPEDTLLPPK